MNLLKAILTYKLIKVMKFPVIQPYVTTPSELTRYKPIKGLEEQGLSNEIQAGWNVNRFLLIKVVRSVVLDA
jgi:hypothetical protein